MATARGTVTGFYQYKAQGPGGKKAPAKVTVDHGNGESAEYKSWSAVDVEIGQEVEITYETTQSGGYVNNMIMGIKSLGAAPASSKGGGGGGNSNQQGSIESSVAYKGAVEITTALIASGGVKPAGIEASLNEWYQKSINLIQHGTSEYNPFEDE